MANELENQLHHLNITSDVDKLLQDVEEIHQKVNVLKSALRTNLHILNFDHKPQIQQNFRNRNHCNGM